MYSAKEISKILGCKPFVVSDLEIDVVSIDSRSVNTPEKTLFFALKGKNHNGHAYIKGLYEKGVRHFVISESVPDRDMMSGANFFEVNDVLKALQQLAAFHRRHKKAKVIGITGSNGKTVVKEWLYQLLADDFVVYRSPRSYNSQVGVPLSLLGIEDTTQIAVIEAGISQRGEMVRLQYMIKPEIGIFTHLGDAHGENFASREEKLTEKAALFSECSYVIGHEGMAMDRIALALSPETVVMTWGESDRSTVKVYVRHIGLADRTVDVYFNDRSFTLTIPFADEASFENGMNAVCILLLKAVAPEKIVERVKHLQPIAMRMEIKEGFHRCILIHDYYNSDPVSFQLALNTLAMQDPKKKRVVILSDFIDVGADNRELYQEVAVMLDKAGVSEFVGIGENINRCKAYFQRIESRFYKDTDSFLKHENRDRYKDRVVLIKGARKYRFEYIAGFLQQQSHNTILEVNLDAMVHNLNYFRSRVPWHTKMAVMVKAFSYGSGLTEVASLLQYQGVDYLMVAYADEGVELRTAGITIPIAVMNPEPEAFDHIIEFNLEPEIYSMELLEAFDRALVRHGAERYPIHLKLNTGMNRSGLDEEDIIALLGFFETKRNVVIRSVFSHLAGSDEAIHDDYTLFQIKSFAAMTEQIQSRFDYKIWRHILNSAGIERFSEYSFDMVRLGIGLHGISAVGAPLLPVSSFKTYIASLRTVKKHQTVGYGRKGIIERNSRIALIPVGYADGLNRHLSNGVEEMMVNGKRVPVIGNICMDACMLDVTDVNVKVGDEVEIFGEHIPVTELAEKLGTIPYEILTSISQRVRRVYFKE